VLVLDKQIDRCVKFLGHLDLKTMVIQRLRFGGALNRHNWQSIADGDPWNLPLVLCDWDLDGYWHGFGF
jgi:hypothetical protein